MAKYSEVEDQEIVVTEVLPFEPDWEINTTVYAGEDAIIHFEIDAYDPDGTALSYEWYLNEEMPVGNDYFYDFDLDTNIGDYYYLSVNIWDGFWDRNGERSSVYYQWEIVITGALSTPENVQISLAGTSVQLSWDEVSGATKYNIYASDDPYTGFTKISEVTGYTSWNYPITSDKKFYRVTAE
jgi:hypothetical protein